MKKLAIAAFAASTLLASSAAAQAYAECGYDEDAPIFGMGMAVGTVATPVLAPLEQNIVQRGDRSDTLRSVPVPATKVDGWTADYAMMRLSHLAGRPTWAHTETGEVGDVISVDIPATNLADAFDRIAETKGKRWRYDGENVYLLGGREWTMPLPSSRDLVLAVKDTLEKNNVKASIEGGMLRFEADDAGVARISAVVNQVYRQERLNPYDVKFYKVYPTKGAIDWTTLVERTDAIETVSFEGKGATIVLEPTAGAVIDAFLAREGQVHALGSTTMVSGQTSLGSSRAVGCGTGAIASRGLELAGGAYERGRVSLAYSILGSQQEQAGRLAVTPGAVVVIADAEPDEGGYVVSVVRPRVLELQMPVQLPGPTGTHIAAR